MTGTESTDAFAIPGFRRSLMAVPGSGRVVAALEDDIHCMSVALEHDGERITSVEGRMHRWPWTSCPGAAEVLQRTFVGAQLAKAARPKEKPANCTHLYDLAVLAAAHALAERPMRYDIAVSDPVDGLVHAQLRCDAAPLLQWVLRDDVVIEPADAAGTPLGALRGWIDQLPSEMREAARLLQWASFIAHGRWIPMERQSDATVMPAKCYSFQPEVAPHADRFGLVIDFSADGTLPLAAMPVE